MDTVISHAEGICAVIERIISAEKRRVKVFHWVFTKRHGGEKKRNDSKDLNHPVDILGFHLGGPPPLCFSLLTHSMCMEHC